MREEGGREVVVDASGEFAIAATAPFLVLTLLTGRD